MEYVKEIIAINKQKDKYKYFEYYEEIISTIEKHVVSNPDIAIESCKSLVEGVSKTILKTLDLTLNDIEINKFDFQPLFKKAMSALADKHETFEQDFVNRSNALIHLLGEIRNRRGDISHGRLAPKEEYSSHHFSALIVRMTDSILHYILAHYFSIELLSDDDIQYEDNFDFNEILDKTYPLDNICYSKALYDQDYYAYCNALNEHRSKEVEEILDIQENIQVEVEEAIAVKVEEILDIQESIQVEEAIAVKVEESDEEIYVLPALKAQNQVVAFEKLCEEQNLRKKHVAKIIDTYLFDGRKPLSDEVINALYVKPKLLERRQVADELTNKIVDFVKVELNGMLDELSK
jgi:hypothetical protein